MSFLRMTILQNLPFHLISEIFLRFHLKIEVNIQIQYFHANQVLLLNVKMTIQS